MIILMSKTRSKSSQPADLDKVLLSEEPDPQVIPGNTEFGNRYTRAYKLKVLRETEACSKSGDLGLYLRPLVA